MHEIPADDFAGMVARAVEALPETFRERIANLDFSVEEWAAPEDYERTRSPRGSTMLGVYRGIPLSRRGSGYHMTLPDRIVIFRGPLQQLAADEADLADRVAHVVRHEVAHYFGISDDRLREIDAY
jgi:predicted Zn-dependent protease with MMP-like domain